MYFRLVGLYDKYYFTPSRATYLFDEDWDVAIILDGCRYDLAADYVESHSIDLDQPREVWSVGSWSPDWLRRTFDSVPEGVLNGTSYITANVFTNEVPESSLGNVDKVWKYAWNEDLGTVPPRPVTDRSISAIREGTFDRYLIHYMQPHLPPVNEQADAFPGFRPHEGEPGRGRDKVEWEPVKSGDIDPDTAREAYRENLLPVLDDLEVLLENIDAENVVITADHGNYLGEQGRWGHPRDHIHPAVRKVPWWETTASNENTHTPDSHTTASEETDREEKLKALGYR